MKMTAGRKCKVASILLSTVANPKTGFVTCIPTGTLPTLWGDQMPAHGNNFFSPLCKVNSVQEACTKCFRVYIFKFEILRTT